MSVGSNDEVAEQAAVPEGWEGVTLPWLRSNAGGRGGYSPPRPLLLRQKSAGLSISPRLVEERHRSAVRTAQPEHAVVRWSCRGCR